MSTVPDAPVTSYAARVQALNTDLVKNVDAIRRDYRSVSTAITEAETRKSELERQIAAMQSELQGTSQMLEGLQATKARLARSLAEADRTYQQIIQSSEALLSLLQRESHDVVLPRPSQPPR
ncbi:hypothetical protein BC828DRAFT_402570 [Blastocladiella britannica]|nr:hypothetical protein BC828DRAFT_402570 [Blastocladiella britannica]